MRISDWSSDVCSSDLLAPDLGGMGCKNGNDERLVEKLHDVIDTNIMTLQALERCTHIGSWLCCNALAILGQIGEPRKQHEDQHERDSNEELSVGQGCVRTCRCRGYAVKKHKKT